jgi:hypothetical protein
MHLIRQRCLAGEAAILSAAKAEGESGNPEQAERSGTLRGNGQQTGTFSRLAF